MKQKGYDTLKPYTSSPLGTVLAAVMDKQRSKHYNGRN
jgi:hypothetical protein